MSRVCLELEYDWSPVTCSDGAPYAYPKPVRNVRDSFHGPAVYRWRFMDESKLVAVYFGECADLLKELNQSVNPSPGQKPGRIKAALGERMLLGQTGVIDTLKLGSLKIERSNAGSEPLGDAQIRRAILNLLIFQAADGDAEVLNHETSARDLLSLL